jgi:hypothetical protein
VVGMEEKYKGRWVRKIENKGEKMDDEDRIFRFEGANRG